MLQNLSFAIFAVAFTQIVTSQIVLPGQCPQIKAMTEFNLEAYTGLWYQYSKYSTVWETDYKCSYAKYSDLGDNTVSVHNGAIDTLTGEPQIIDGYAKVLGPATLAVVFFNGQSETQPNYQVLGTDYRTYAVVYSCSELSLSHGEFLWILTRYRIPSEQTIEAAKKVIDDNKLSQTFLIKTEQEDCRPVIDPDVN